MAKSGIAYAAIKPPGILMSTPSMSRRRVMWFFVASPIWGVALAFLLAPLGGPPATLALLVAAAGTCVGLVMVATNADWTGVGRFMLAAIYAMAAMFVLFFGGWGAAMVARGGG